MLACDGPFPGLLCGGGRDDVVRGWREICGKGKLFSGRRSAGNKVANNTSGAAGQLECG